ncbi:MAG: GNAT family N-acetyltransferase [Candidatus Promineofilum sp.]|nr:GNAT family N-acetyltransferase [Promineifilum sp.]
MGIDIVPFHVGLLPGAAELLARRHVRDRAAMPLLPSRFEQPKMALAAVREVWSKPYTSGVAAWRDGRLVGYLVGEAKFDTLRGRHVWMHLPGYALAEGEAVDLYADLYAAAGPEWLRLGAFDHYVMAPAGDGDALALWFGLSFGQEQVHSILSLAGPLPERPALPGVTIRRATEADRDMFVDEMSPILRQHMAGPPVWGVALPERVAPMREGFAELLTDEAARVWIAESDGQAEAGRLLGYQFYYPAPPADDNLMVSLTERTTLIEAAATRPDARWRGIGRALAAAGMADAAAAGFHLCIADWRTTNIEAARFWPRLGFQPAACRLVRKIDPRIAWATY